LHGIPKEDDGSSKANAKKVRFLVKKAWIAILLFLLIFNLFATEFKVATFNLHGLHPTNQGQRYFQDASGKLSLAPSNLFYFTPKELINGSILRNKYIARWILDQRVDLVFLQEVVSGSVSGKKDCSSFKDGKYPQQFENQSQAIAKKTGSFVSYLACRGNRGWVTDKNTFNRGKIVKLVKGSPQTVFNIGDNPYPGGLVVEGMAFVVNPKKISVVSNKSMDISYNKYGDKLFFQLLKFKIKGSHKFFYAANVHQGHKVSGFEQALALRVYLEKLVSTDRVNKNFGGVVIAGDFNARLYHSPVSKISEVTLIPILLKNHADYSFLLDGFFQKKLEKLEKELWNLNNSSYKRWATIFSAKEAKNRIISAVSNFKKFQLQFGASIFKFKEALEVSRRASKCGSQCNRKNRIDFVFYAGELSPSSSHVFFNHHDWAQVSGTYSDHPAIVSTFSL
jgi:hypothetical protein